MLKQLLAYFFVLAFSTTLLSQDLITNSYFIDFGIALPSTKETHYASNFRNGIGYLVNFGYERNSAKAINRVSVSFMQAAQGKENVSYSNLLRPEVRYEHLRKRDEKNLNLGGYYDVGALLNFRRGSWPSENNINYSIWSSLGLVATYKKLLTLNSKQFSWDTKFSLPLLTYLIRPSYTFPYTDNYLEDGVFNFDRSGLGEKIVTGGNIVTINKFMNVGFQTGIALPSKNERWDYGLTYSFNYFQTNELKPVFQIIHALHLSVNLK